ncbi:MAG: TMAO reductase system periplasmic protein TorT, partial [bacterium]|nr:TMAO reductase system periplasmic protein TorT [bacterium]
MKLMAGLLALGLVAAACGDDDTSSDTASDAAPTAASDSTASDGAVDEPEVESEPAPAEEPTVEGETAPAEEPTAEDEPEAVRADWAGTLIEVWSVPFDMGSSRTTIAYEPTTATQEWNLCVSFPHMKDAYWLGVNYGAAEESKRQGVKMTLVEAGGYTELPTQISQIEDCVQGGADAVIIGAISFDGLNNLVDEIVAGGIPVIDVINGMSSPNLTAKSLVSFGEMGAHACNWVAENVGDEPTKIAWFPGPAGAGWVEAGDAGCKGALEGTSVEIVDTKFGDTGKEAQSVLIEDALAANPDIDFIVGTAVTAEAA